MRKYLQNIVEAQNRVMGINRRNIEFVYPLNPRSEQKLANDKALSKILLEKEGIPVPQTYAIVEHLWELEQKLSGVEHLESLVVKPSLGSGGNGILILRKHPDGYTLPGGKTIDMERLKMHIATILYGAFAHDHADKAILEECLSPHPFFRNIYDTGIPDVRVIVHMDTPVMAMLRIPTRRSRGKANLHQGALGIGIDLKTGCLGYGIQKQKRIEAHPDSGNLFRGLAIPGWKQFLEISRQTARLVPLKYLGVDIILDEKKGPLVIEINSRPGLQIQNSNQIGLLEVLANHSYESR